MPVSHTSAGKLGIIAGGGPLPVLLARACLAENRELLIIGIIGEASPEIAGYPHLWAGIGAVGTVMRALRREACTEVVFVGPVRRPDLKNLRLDWGGVRVLPGYIRAARGGDDQLLRYMVSHFEAHGFKVIGAHQVLGNLVVPAGLLGRHSPKPEHQTDIRRAAEVASVIGALDIGQGAVVSGGVVIAVEAAEGTDAMLARCAQLLPATADRRGVYAKLPKPGQERRIDLPAIGVSTVRLAAAAGLAGVVFEAEGVLIIDLANVVRVADELGVFLLALDSAELAK